MSEPNIESLWEDLLSKNKLTVAQAASELSSYYLSQDEYILTEELSKKAIEIFKSQEFGFNSDVYQCYINYALSLSEQDRVQQAINVINYVLTTSHLSHQSFYSELMFIKAHLLLNIGKASEALKAYEELLLTLDLNDDIIKLNVTYLCIAEIHIMKRDIVKTKEILEHYNRAYDENRDLDNILSYLKFKAQIFLWEKNNEAARNVYQEAVEIAKALNNNFEIAYLQYLIASCEYELHNYRNSQIYAIAARSTLLNNDLKNKDGLIEIKLLLDKLKIKINPLFTLTSKIFSRHN